MRRRRPAIPQIPLKDAAAQELMRRAGRIVAQTFAKIGEAMQPGVTTAELDTLAEQIIRGLGATPAFLDYNGYPATACISINDEVVHGIPGPRIVNEGDIVGVDLGAIYQGWYADSAYTFAVGTVSDNAKRLMDVGQQALAAGITAAIPGARVNDIGAAIERYVAQHGFAVVRDLCGHGIGQRLHEEPQVPNYPASSGNAILQPGMALAIEPMVNAGRAEVVLQADGWTFVTADHTLSVHYEHTVLIQPDGPEIITALR